MLQNGICIIRRPFLVTGLCSFNFIFDDKNCVIEKAMLLE